MEKIKQNVLNIKLGKRGDKRQETCSFIFVWHGTVYMIPTHNE